MSREAGCNHHLSKPFSRGQLLSVLEEYGRLTQPAGTDALEPEVRALIPGYLENVSRDLLRLSRAAEVSDFDQIHTIAHNLKGSGAGYGFPHLSSIGTAWKRPRGNRIRD